MPAHANQFCDYGERATMRHGNANVCEFCFWCETQLVKGGEHKRRAEPKPKPVVKRYPAWHRMVEIVRELHGKHAFWNKRNDPAEKFHALFRKHGAMPDDA